MKRALVGTGRGVRSKNFCRIFSFWRLSLSPPEPPGIGRSGKSRKLPAIPLPLPVSHYTTRFIAGGCFHRGVAIIPGEQPKIRRSSRSFSGSSKRGESTRIIPLAWVRAPEILLPILVDSTTYFYYLIHSFVQEWPTVRIGSHTAWHNGRKVSRDLAKKA